MKKLKIADADGPLKDYVKHLDGAPLIVTDKGKPVLALVPLQGVDLESVSIHTDPDFLDVLEHSDEQHAAGLTIPADEMWRRLGLEK